MDINEIYEQVENEILEIPKFSKKTSKENLTKIYDLMNISSRGIIHVAGTNGKGSVCAYLTSVFMESGKKVGTFTSPHLISMTERIKVNNKEISKEMFVEAYKCVTDAVEKVLKEGGAYPSFFEMLFLMAMYVFYNEDVEYTILETGLGGRLDATNMFSKPLISVITSISLDHMEILGETIEEIAGEKAGIIKENVPVVYYGENEKVRKVIEKEAFNKHSKGYIVKKSDILSIKKCKNDIAFSLNCGYYEYGNLIVPFIADYQVINASLAVRVIEAIIETTGTYISRECIERGIKNTRWEARMEQVMDGVFIDGAHNDDGIEEFVKVVSEYPCVGRKLVLFSAVKEKEYHKMIKRIATETGFTEFFIPTIDSNRALQSEEICDILSRYTDKSRIHGFNNSKDALKEALKMKMKEDVLFIAGSLYLAGEIKKHLQTYTKQTND